MRFSSSFIITFFVIATMSVTAMDKPAWVQKSDAHAQILLDVLAELAPESAGAMGVEGLDEKILSLEPGYVEKQVDELTKAQDELKRRLNAETDVRVKQDLEILINATLENLEDIRIQQKYFLPYHNPAGTIYNGLQSLLDDQIAEERRPTALVRLLKYVGAEPGYTPFVEQAQQDIVAKLNDTSLLYPLKEEIERDIANSEYMLNGIPELFEKYEVKGYKKHHKKLVQQIKDYNEFLETTVLPKARTDFRLPKEVYDFNLAQYGIDMPIEVLMARGKAGFKELQNEMQTLAFIIAEKRNLPSSDYRDVIRELKKEQFAGDEILTHYHQVNKNLEDIIKREGILTLPDRDLIIRLASEAESAQVPAPHMSPPRLIGNTGEQGEFVLPLNIPSSGDEELVIDDFMYEAASWTLSAHEARPGHELQYASMVEQGVSLARAMFNFNSVNVEGWALYMEAEVKPYLPIEGQLISLFARLWRAARAFVDPGLQFGHITRDDAYRVLREDVVISEAMTRSELMRYTFRAPGQATSYYCGYLRLMELRTDTELILGEKFDRQSYHDFILKQGLLSPTMLRKAVLEEFVPQAKG